MYKRRRGAAHTVLFLFLSVMIQYSSQAQGARVWFADYQLEGARENEIVADKGFNGLTLLFKHEVPEGLYVETGAGERYKVERDDHMTERVQSNLIYLGQEQHTFKIIGLRQQEQVRIYFQYVPEISVDIKNLSGSEDCSEPPVVPQSVWRAGLEPPVPGRKSTPTRHCIVHHSASPNSDTNSINLVRSFYIYHKDVNGWDDIGYNYLIGHDGTIFAGRDPEKPEISQDNVFGAHFCAKNSYTMGICVIGSFEEEAPDVRAVESLRHLLTWKIYKDDMDPLDSLHHPDTLTGDLLPVLAGHRNGCATSCPGQLLFDQLPQIRLDVRHDIESCGPLGNEVLTAGKVRVYPNPAVSFLRVEHPGTASYVLTDMSGRRIRSGVMEEDTEIDVGGCSYGVYVLKVWNRDGMWVERVFIGGK